MITSTIRSSLGAIALLVGVAFVPFAARAQTNSGLLIAPFPEEDAVNAEAGAIVFNGGHIAEPEIDESFRMQIYGSQGRFRIMPGELKSPRIGYDFVYLDLDTGFDALPNHLVDQSVAFGFPIAQIDEWIIGGSVGLGYAGDGGFGDGDAWYGLASIAAFKQIDDNSAWVFLLDYDGNRTFLPDVPLPGFAYKRRIQEKLHMTLGLPISSVEWEPIDNLKLELIYSLPDDIRIDVGYTIVPNVTVFGRVRHEREAFYVDDLPENYDRILFEQRRAEVGMRFGPTETIAFDVAVGYAWSTEFSEGFDFRESNEIADVSDEPYVRAGLELKFYMQSAAADTNLAIDLHDVAKVYKGRVHALQGIEMRVRRGEVFGLLGPNGAGKSTLVKIMLTVIRPTRVVGTLLGAPVGYKPTLQRVGYLPENHRFPRYLTGRQTLEFFSALHKVDRPTRKRRANELLDTVGMTAWADKKVAMYSKGMMQRIGLAQALGGDPDLVVLDEPTDGVDPVGRRDIRDVLIRIRDQGKTVFVNSHLLSELEMICNRVAILVQGRVVKQGTLDELTLAKQCYEIEAEPNGDPLAQRQKMIAAVPGALVEVETPMAPANAPMARPPYPPPLASPPPLNYAGVAPVLGAPVPRLPLMRGKLANGAWAEIEGLTLRVGVLDAAAIQPILDAMRAAGVVIRRVQSKRQSLEDLFMEAVTDPTTGLAAAPGAQQRGRP